MDPRESGGRSAAHKTTSPPHAHRDRRRLRGHRHEPALHDSRVLLRRPLGGTDYENVLGILSLILYALIIVVSLKYIAIVMRADNQGEGGILALTALLPERRGGTAAGPRPLGPGAARHFGAALLYGDGMITPAITVLGAIEGLRWRRRFSRVRRPAVTLIIVGIFVIQSTGPTRSGGSSVPIMVVWFVAIAGSACRGSARAGVLGALDPRYGVLFFSDNGWMGFAVLGAVVLGVTGGEALYADMGHFGKQADPASPGSCWSARADPQLLRTGSAAAPSARDGVTHPFYPMAPRGRCFRSS